MANDTALPVMGENLKHLDALEVDQASLARLAGGDPAWAGRAPALPGGGFDDGFVFPALVCMARELMRARQLRADLLERRPALLKLRGEAKRGELPTGSSSVISICQQVLALGGPPAGEG